MDVVCDFLAYFLGKDDLTFLDQTRQRAPGIPLLFNRYLALNSNQCAGIDDP